MQAFSRLQAFSASDRLSLLKHTRPQTEYSWRLNRRVRRGMLVDDPPAPDKDMSETAGVRTSPYSSNGPAVFTVSRWKAHKRCVREFKIPHLHPWRHGQLDVMLQFQCVCFMIESSTFLPQSTSNSISLQHKPLLETPQWSLHIEHHAGLDRPSSCPGMHLDLPLPLPAGKLMTCTHTKEKFRLVREVFNIKCDT